MSFSIRATIRDLLAPEHQISCSSCLWQQGMAELKRRGKGHRESGAFILGWREGNKRRIAKYIYYDDLDPHCLDSGIIVLDGSVVGRLWKICRKTGFVVVADVHTHAGRPYQSKIDQVNPMIGVAGHIAIIVPGLAMQKVKASELGVYEYRGRHQWQPHLDREAARFFYIGRWS